MDLKVFLTRYFSIILIIATFTFLSGCSSLGPKTIQPDELPTPEKVDLPEENKSASDSRANASHSLTREGYMLLCKKEYDGAIRLLEKAVGINPSDGPGYFYLSEAWIGKNNYKLAFQFNRLALIYLRNNEKWIERTQFQTKAINSMK